MKRASLFLLLFLLTLSTQSLVVMPAFVKASGNHFTLMGKPYRYMGCNYWYGGYLAMDSLHNGKERLQQELDFLRDHGITNLRTFFCGEGDGRYPYRISPAVQEKKGKYNEEILKSFDFFLEQCEIRNIKVVIVLNNNWEWSGGFGQYLEWAGKGKAPLPKTKRWDWNRYCGYISQFYSCKECQSSYQQWISKIVLRRNTITGSSYIYDNTIMAWELANEPRPMTSAAKENFFNWVVKTSEYIKNIDPNHLVTIGSEGHIGTSYDLSLFRRIHAIQSIDYATIHLWPQTWNWFKDLKEANADSTLKKSSDYIQQNNEIIKGLNKPLVMEEFGMRRDGASFSKEAGTTARDQYFHFLIEQFKMQKLAGMNFWGFAGKEGKAIQKWFWKKGDPYSADPPQEEQGLFGVYESDLSTWETLSTFRED